MDNQRFGAFIADTRRKRGLSQRQLAERLGVTDKAVSKWERGLGFPDIKTIEPLADALGLTVLELMQSRRAAEQIHAEAANQAVGQVIDRAIHQQKLERRNLVIGCLGLVLTAALVFLIDEMQFFGFVMICIPIICGLLGIWLIAVGLRRWKQGSVFKALLIGGVILLLVPVGKLLLLLLAMLLGGPVPT